ncbi:MAG: LacI family DNA-binding transcriptional regulator [Cellulomonas sp.]
MGPGRNGVRRPTIADIASRAGVSTGAVSYALNGRPGVSDQTRARVLRIADEVGWTPNSAARALSGVGTATAGLVITRPASVLGVEPFFMSFVSGIEAVLAERGFALLLQVAPTIERELETYRTWWAARRVDGVFVVDLRLSDPRISHLVDLGLPAVVVGDPAHAGSLPVIWSDDAQAAVEAVRHLAAFGHRRVAHVTGPEYLVHTRVRGDAFSATATQLGMEQMVVATDFTLDAGTAATRELLLRENPPTAIVFDNDLMAVGAVKVATELGLRVPTDLSILAWDDSTLCRLTTPPLSTLSRDVMAYGADAATVLLDTIAGVPIVSPHRSVARLVERGSVAPPPR